MKIEHVQTFVVGTPYPHIGGRYWVFLKLVTNNSVVGYGEVYCAPFHPDVVAKMIEDVCQRKVIGRDPFKIEKLWHAIYGSGYTQHPDLSLLAVLSGIEMACWDIIGKELGKPVYELLGGRVHERLRAYTYLYPKEDEESEVYSDADLAAERATEYAAMGFTAVKFDPVGPYTSFDPRQLSLHALDRGEQFAKKIREAVGGRCDLLFGTHGQMTPASAIRLARRLEPYDPLWLEEPTGPENPEQMAIVARATSIPIATGERLSTKHDFLKVLQAGAAAILQPALGRVGGILEGKKIAGMAEAFYAQIAPHMYCGPIAAAADIQLSTCSPNFLIQECIQDMSGFHAKVVTNPIKVEEGYVLPPKEPGLGVQLDDEIARRHPYGGHELHLEMSDEPLSE